MPIALYFFKAVSHSSLVRAGNHQIGDLFLRIPDTVYSPYIAHNPDDGTGYVLVHGHPLNGTKFFTWGQSGPGRFMQALPIAAYRGLV